MIRFGLIIKGHYKNAFVLLAFLSLLTVAPSMAIGSGFEVYKGCFKDLKGWEHDNVEGMSMSYSGINMVTANTRYTSGKKEVEVTFMEGSLPGMQQPNLDGTFEMETSEGSVKMKTINGKKVTIVHDKTNNTSTVAIILKEPKGENGPGAMLNFVGTNVGTKELLGFAQEFDWKCFEKKGHAR